MSYNSDSLYAGQGDDARSGDLQGPAPALRVYTLGRFEVRAGDRLIIDESWSRSRAKAILKLLAVEGGPLKRDQVVEVLWPDSDAAAGGNSLRQTLYNLRSAFAGNGLPSTVVSEDESLCLSADVWTDVAAFRAAAAAARASRSDMRLYEKAVGLYHGDLLPHDLYQEWTHLPRNDLRALYLRLLSEAADLCRAEGRCETAEELLLRVLHADPMREQEHRMLMRVYAHCGRRAEAVRQYHTCRDILRRELGIEPSAETEALYRELINEYPEPGPAAAATAIRAPPSPAPATPEIRYAETADGVRIACSPYGEGDALVMVPLVPCSHLVLEWQTPLVRNFYEALAHGRRIVRYDTRGNGVTGGQLSRYTLDALVTDLEAVVDDLGLESFALYASLHAGPIAIKYTAGNPGRVSKLVLWGCYARGADYFDEPAVIALSDLLEKDWKQYCRVLGYAFTGWAGGEVSDALVNQISLASSPDIVRAFMRDARGFDSSGLLPEVRCPALIMHRRKAPVLVEAAKRIASAMPRGRLLFLDRTMAVPWSEKAEEVVAEIDRFLRE